MVIFETPQSSRSKIKFTLERPEACLHDLDLDDFKFLNPYSLIVTLPSKYLYDSGILSFYQSSVGCVCKDQNVPIIKLLKSL